MLAIRVRNAGRAVTTRPLVTDQLLARQPLPPDVRGEIRNELRTLRLTRFVPHASISAEEIAKSSMREVPIEFNVGGSPLQFMVNGQPYAPDRIDQTLVLGKAQAWRLSSAAASHPFHIHVNPFQIVSVRKKDASGQPFGPEIVDGHCRHARHLEGHDLCSPTWYSRTRDDATSASRPALHSRHEPGDDAERADGCRTARASIDEGHH